ncbi:Ig-like domain-containing protein [Candidatus Peregrinibacteria bacterium]|nr:Ig-like domain-containing protein [Candidatus Peregrinibacteria bacterium]
MEKRKIKKWVIVLLMTLSVAGGLAVFLNSGKVALFKGNAGGGSSPPVLIFLNKDETGEYIPINNSMSELGSTYNDQVSAIYVEPGHGVAAFTEKNYQGQCKYFTEETLDLGNFDNAISSIDLDGTCPSTPPSAPKELAFIDMPREILAFDAAGGGGGTTAPTAGTPPATWNDPYCSARNSESSCLDPNVEGNRVCYWTPEDYPDDEDPTNYPASCHSERGTITMIWPIANVTIAPSPQTIRAKAINISTPRFKVNGAEIPAVKDTAIYTWKADWDATNLPDGTYIISVTGIDQYQRAIENGTFTITLKKTAAATPPAGGGTGSTGDTGGTGGTSGDTGTTGGTGGTAGSTGTTGGLTLIPDPAFKYDSTVNDIAQVETKIVASFSIQNSSAGAVTISKLKLFYAPILSNLLPSDQVERVTLFNEQATKIGEPVNLGEICTGTTCEDPSALWQGGDLRLTIGANITAKLYAKARVKSTAPIDKNFYFRITPKSVSLQNNSFVPLQGSPAPASFDMKQFKVVAAQTTGGETGGQSDSTTPGNIAVSPDPDFNSAPSHKIVSGDKDFTIASFFIENKFTQTQAIQKININYDNTSTLPKDQLFNVRLIRYPSTTIGAATTLSAAGVASWTLSNVSLPAASTTSKPQQFKVVASLKDSAEAGKNFSFYITPASIVAQNATTNMAAAINMPAFTVTAPAQTPADGEPAKLTVSLSSGTPPDGQIRKPADGAFTATELNMVSTGEVQFRAVTVSMKAGVAGALSPSKIARVQLFDENGNSISNPLMFDSNGRARLPTSWKFASAGTHKLIMKVTLAGDATQNTQFALGIRQNSDIELSTGTVNATNFPVFGGNAMVATTSGTQPPAPKTTCEDRGQYTYTGGMCIDCPITVYVRNGGQCEVAKTDKKAAEKPSAKPATDKTAGASIPEVLQASSLQIRLDQLKQELAQAKAKAAAQASASASAQNGRNQAAGAGTAGSSNQSANSQRSAATEPNLTGSQRLVRAPERSGTGPEVLVYFGILAIVQGAMIIRKRLK